MSGTHWTKKQEKLLRENLGILTYDAIGKRLGKTGRAVRQKKIRMELGNPKDILDYVAIKYLAKIIHSSVKTIKKWTKEKGLNVDYKTVAHVQVISRINITGFWKWAEKHQKLINWSEFEFESLGPEPKWTKEARRNIKNRRINWTTQKESLLESYYNIGLSWKQIGANLGITGGAANTRYRLILRRREKDIKTS